MDARRSHTGRASPRRGACGFLMRRGMRIPRIQTLIERGVRKPLLVMLGARGSGKATQTAAFARDWEARSDSGTAWFTVTPADADLNSFWTSMLVSLGEGLLDGFTSNESTSSAVLDIGSDPWLEELADRLERSGVKLLWVINDLEQVENGTVLGSLEQFASIVPDNVHLVVLSRSSRIPLSRLRLEERVAEVLPEDLALTEQEVRALASMKGLKLSPKEACELRNLTRGWAAGVHMILLRADRTGQGIDLRTICGNDQWFIDYLNEEVLPELSEDARSLALKICAVKGFTRAMLEQAFGCRQSVKVLGELRAANLAVPLLGAPLGERPEENWFECHPLFVGPLRHMMFMEKSSEAIYVAVQMAVDWYEKCFHYDFAIETALAQGDYDRVFDLVTKHLYPILTAADSSTFSQWFEGLEHPHGEKEYLFFLVNAWASFISGKTKRAHMWLTRIEESAFDEDASMLRGCNSVYQAVKVGTLVFTGEYKSALELGSASLDNLGGPQLFLRCTIMHNLGEALERLGRYHEAYEYFMRAKVNAEISGRRVVELLCANEIAWIRFAQGKLDACSNVAMRALSSCNGEELEDSWAVGLLQVALSRTYLQWANDARAAACLEKALKLLGPHTNLDGYLEAQVMLSQLHLFRGEKDEALDVLLEAYETLQVDSVPRGINLLVLTIYAMSLVEVGRFSQAEEVLEEARMQTREEDSYYRVRQLLTRAQLLWVQNAFVEALCDLGRAWVLAEDAELVLLSVDLLRLKACLLYASGDKEKALDVFAEALDRAAPEGYLLPFMNGMPHLDALLFETAHPANKNLVLNDTRQTARKFAQTIIERKGFRKTSVLESSEIPASDPGKILSDRELQVYDLLKQGKTRKQISEFLGIQINTVRTHVRNIYQKLGVHERSAL